MRARELLVLDLMIQFARVAEQLRRTGDELGTLLVRAQAIAGAEAWPVVRLVPEPPFYSCFCHPSVHERGAPGCVHYVSADG